MRTGTLQTTGNTVAQASQTIASGDARSAALHTGQRRRSRTAADSDIIPAGRAFARWPEPDAAMPLPAATPSTFSDLPTSIIACHDRRDHIRQDRFSAVPLSR